MEAAASAAAKTDEALAAAAPVPEGSWETAWHDLDAGALSDVDSDVGVSARRRPSRRHSSPEGTPGRGEGERPALLPSAEQVLGPELGQQAQPPQPPQEPQLSPEPDVAEMQSRFDRAKVRSQPAFQKEWMQTY
jgi:hypothetical protein